MKGFSFPGKSPVKNKESKLVKDKNQEQGYQPTVTSGVQTFKSVQRLKDAGAPKDVINKEYNKQVDLFKQRA